MSNTDSYPQSKQDPNTEKRTVKKYNGLEGEREENVASCLGFWLGVSREMGPRGIIHVWLGSSLIFFANVEF